jgi:hypothetical protein
MTTHNRGCILSRREVLIGHWVSEDQGMRLCAGWLKSFVSEVPVEWIPAGDLFWRPWPGHR